MSCFLNIPQVSTHDLMKELILMCHINQKTAYPIPVVYNSLLKIEVLCDEGISIAIMGNPTLNSVCAKYNPFSKMVY